MYYCNEFLSLNVLSLYEGELIGVVDKLYFDKKMKKLIQLELIGENDTRLILPTKNIYHIGKNVLNVQIRNEVLETVLKYIPHDVIKVTLQCPQKVKGKQQQLITPLLSDKQKKYLHSKGLFWCDG